MTVWWELPKLVCNKLLVPVLKTLFYHAYIILCYWESIPNQLGMIERIFENILKVDIKFEHNFQCDFYISDTLKKPSKSFPKSTNATLKLTIQNKEGTTNAGLQVCTRLPAFTTSLPGSQTVVLAFAFLAKLQKRRWDTWKTGDHLPTVILTQSQISWSGPSAWMSKKCKSNYSMLNVSLSYTCSKATRVFF